jgi:hypothetical protein
MWLRLWLVVPSIATLLVMSGCSSPDGFALFPGTGADGKSAEASNASTCPTPEKCAAQLKILVSDPVRDWVGRPQPPDSYANGTRLFAYRVLKKKLSCDELGRALAEIEAAAPALQAAGYDAPRKLMSEVTRELSVEKDKRCRRQV